MSEDNLEKDKPVSGRGFLGRWSERKHDAARRDGESQEVELSVSPDDIESAAEADLQNNLTAIEENQKSEPELPPGDEDMPPIESLTEDSDYAQFLSPRVSEHLQRQAMRKLFGIPGFNLRDGLDDYDDDFTSFAALGDIVTADMKYQLERQAELRAREEAEAEAETASVIEDAENTVESAEEHIDQEPSDDRLEEKVVEQHSVEPEAEEQSPAPLDGLPVDGEVQDVEDVSNEEI